MPGFRNYLQSVHAWYEAGGYRVGSKDTGRYGSSGRSGLQEIDRVGWTTNGRLNEVTLLQTPKGAVNRTFFVCVRLCQCDYPASTYQPWQIRSKYQISGSFEARLR